MKNKQIEFFKNWITTLKKELLVLYLSYKTPCTPLYTKCFALLVVAYALSPIDLIPDFIPVIGYLDDLIIVPIGIYLCLKLIPNEILTEMRKKALDYEWNKSKNWFMAILILLIWFTLLFWLTKLFISYV